MCPTDYEPYYIRHLPHIQPAGATFFVTCRLAGSLPRQILEELRDIKERIVQDLDKTPEKSSKAQQAYRSYRRLFGQWDKALAQANFGPIWLGEPEIATLVADSMHYRDSIIYDLLTYCIMPNHLHIVFKPLPDADHHYPSVTAIMQSLKGYTARNSNKVLNRRGQFWQHESYDHWVRDEKELLRIIRYVISNPVKAGLTDRWQNWPWTYYKTMPQAPEFPS